MFSLTLSVCVSVCARFLRVPRVPRGRNDVLTREAYSLDVICIWFTCHDVDWGIKMIEYWIELETTRKLLPLRLLTLESSEKLEKLRTAWKASKSLKSFEQLQLEKLRKAWKASKRRRSFVPWKPFRARCGVWMYAYSYMHKSMNTGNMHTFSRVCII